MGRKKKAAPAPSEGGQQQYVAVKFDRVLADKLKLIVQHRGGTMSKYLTDLCRVHIEKEYAKALREMVEKAGEPTIRRKGGTE